MVTAAAFVMMVPVTGTPDEARPEHQRDEDHDAREYHDQARNPKPTATPSEPLPLPSFDRLSCYRRRLMLGVIAHIPMMPDGS